MLGRRPDVRHDRLCGRQAGEAGRALLPLVVFAIGACSGPPKPAFHPLPPERTVIELVHPAFDPGSAVHSVSRDPRTGATWYVSEVNGSRALGAIVASDMPPGQEAVRRPIEEWVRGIIPSRFRIAWGTAGETVTSAGPLPYRLFYMGESDDGPVLACVGFSQGRGPVSAGGAPRDLLYGYLCRYGSRPLGQDLAENMLASISLELKR